MSSLPSFLTAATPASQISSTKPTESVKCSFEHSPPLGPSSSLWWPPTLDAPSPPDTVLLFIPGNPGVIDFYIPFLSSIYDSSTTVHGLSFAILAHTHVGYSTNSKTWPKDDHVGLVSQVAALVEVVDTIQKEYGYKTKIILAGHSMGSWLSLQVLKARPDVISSMLLLFPSISNIAGTPNGISLSWLFRPSVPSMIANLSRLSPYIPRGILARLFPAYPRDQLDVLRSFIASPCAVYTSLTLANDEMRTICALDANLLHEHAAKLHFYFAESDGWVGDERERILDVLKETHSSLYPDTVKIVHGHRDIPHAFCINHSVEIASQCVSWMRDGGYL